MQTDIINHNFHCNIALKFSGVILFVCYGLLLTFKILSNGNTRRNSVVRERHIFRVYGYIRNLFNRKFLMKISFLIYSLGLEKTLIIWWLYQPIRRLHFHILKVIIFRCKLSSDWRLFQGIKNNKIKNFMALFNGWSSTVSWLQSHYEKQFSPHEFLVLLWFTLEWLKAESTLVPPSSFEHRTPSLGV